jgi:hypothetical protein
VASVGSSKEKTAAGKDSERYHGRDVIFGSVAWARKAETVVLISKTDVENDDSPRQYSVLPRNGKSERFYMEFAGGELRLVAKPEDAEEDTALNRIEQRVFAKYKPGDMVVYSAEFGSQSSFERWRREAASNGKLAYHSGHYYRPPDLRMRPQ